MAGIGFVIRKLFRKDDISGVLQAYFHAIIATSGPWIFTVIALGTLYTLTKGAYTYGNIDDFRAINLYNFSFSLVFTAPFTIIATRFLADCIFNRDLTSATGMFIGVHIVSFLFMSPFVIGFYFFYVDLTFSIRVISTIHFFLVSSLWISCIFISTLKHYTSISFAFLIGMGAALILSMKLGSVFSTFGLLLGFSLGLIVIIALLTSLVFAQYPKTCHSLFTFLSYFQEHWALALGGLFYSLAIWVDKWVMWFSPEAITLPSGLILYPYYDSAMFIAYLTVIPGMAMFMLSQETAFFERYVKFYKDIRDHANYAKISGNLKRLERNIIYSGRNLIILQSGICISVLVMAPFIFHIVGMNFIQIGIFRYGVIGAGFHVLALFIIITLCYFEHRRGVLALQFFFFISNTLLTIATVYLGFPFYGGGYFLSALMTFVISALVLQNFLYKLPYHTFVTTNSSIILR